MTVTLQTQFSETGQSEPWKNRLASELNFALLIAKQEGAGSIGEEIMLNLIQRVAHFEDITVLKGEE